jgi:hypothetical protein
LPSGILFAESGSVFDVLISGAFVVGHLAISALKSYCLVRPSALFQFTGDRSGTTTNASGKQRNNQ